MNEGVTCHFVFGTILTMKLSVFAALLLVVLSVIVSSNSGFSVIGVQRHPSFAPQATARPNDSKPAASEEEDIALTLEVIREYKKEIESRGNRLPGEDDLDDEGLSRSAITGS